MKKVILTYIVMVSMVIATSSFAADEAVIGYVNLFGGGDRCCSGCSDLSWCDNEAGYLSSKLNSWGFDYVNSPSNKGVEFHEWADEGKDSDGRDHVSPYGVDSADVAFLCTHGSYSTSSGNYKSTVVLGDGGEECNLDYGNYDQDVRWGNTDLNVVIMDACQSVQKVVWQNGGYNSQMRADNMSMLLGFHGYSLDGYWHNWHFENYVDDTRYDSLGDYWVDEMTDLMIGDDECATAVIWSDNQTNADKIYENSGFTDWKMYGTGTVYFYYWNNCDPGGGPEL